MMKGESQSELERRALELLPWYVNGTLAGTERELVSRQALSSLTCRKELERLRRLHLLIQRDDAEAVATDRGLERLMARINSGASAPDANRRGGLFSWTRLAIAAATILALAIPLAWWAGGPATAPATYETLTSRPTAGADAQIRVVFAAGVSAAEQDDLLARHALAIVERARADGVVTLTLADGVDRAAIVDALRRDPRISLVTTPPATPAP